MLKKINTARIMHHLRFGGSASRAELARQTGLDAKTLTNVAGALLKQSWVVLKDTVVAGRGRPAESLAINPDAAFGLGIDLGCQQVTGVVIDLTGAVRSRIRREFSTPRNKKVLLTSAQDIVRDLLATLDKPAIRKVQGIGFCVPGFLDREHGIAVESVNIAGFKNVPITDFFQTRFKLPVILEESSRMMAMAQLWFSPRAAGSYFIGVDLGVGIGMGIVHHGTIYRGSRERSGEIGHTVVEPGGKPCGCGKRGCLETVASGAALAQYARELKLDSISNTLAGGKAIFEAARAGDTRAKKVLRQAGQYIGIAVANVINLFDPDRVILNGGLVQAGDLLVEPLRSAVVEHCINPSGGVCPVEVSELGPMAGAMGAAMLPLVRHFEFENVRFWE